MEKTISYVNFFPDLCNERKVEFRKTDRFGIYRLS
ncbi:hypothetical protein LSS_19640 [Leptospira santarosai serovar Shermani str. LT 821]|uniref:Uncharacterized protein n=1 Tax=Leptospira santarosai serovar Shermani str. LT 821 TaxID=758847 RepID=K8XUD7_9LEPT|nr:hypothetical protein LSS_19640 [Leptospira santarosai serovar Shermani str. LT 821]